MKIKINSRIHNFSIVPLNYSWYLIILEKSSIVSLYDTLSIIFLTTLYSNSSKMLYKTELKALLYGESTQQYEPDYVENLQITTSNSVIVVTSIVLGFSILSLDIKSFINFKSSAELFYSIIFLDVDFDIITETILTQMKSSSTLPSFFNFLINPSKGVKLSSKFQNYGFKTNLFVLNCGMDLMLLIILTSIYLFCKLINTYKQNSITEKIIKNFEFDNFLKLWLSSYLELNLAAILSIFYCKYENKVQITDLIFSFIIIVILIKILNFAAIPAVWLINKKYSKLQINSEKKEFKQKFLSLLNEFKPDVESSYYLIFLIRRISYIFIFLLRGVPTFQISILMIFSLTVKVNRTWSIWLIIMTILINS